MEGYLGVIEALGFSFVPRYYGACSGALIAISQNTALFSLLGNAFGGDGRTTFALPDFRGRVPMGFGRGPGLPNYIMGQKAGQEEVTLNTTHLPSHTHAHSYSGGGGEAVTVDVAAEGGGKIQVPSDGDYIAAPGNALGVPQGYLFLAPGDVTSTATIGGVSGGGGFDPSALSILNTGQNEPFPLVQPGTVINFVICMQGTYPQRS